jgi:paraquat-inducible protein B
VSPTVVGVFVLGALALAVVGVLVFGSGRAFRRTQEFVLYFDRSVNGLRVGAPVKFKGVEVGSVSRIELSLSHRMMAPGHAPIPVVIELDADRISDRGGRVSMTQEGLDDVIAQGFRAQLATESFVTGVLYIELDFFPGSPVNLVHEPEVTVLEIPTLPTALEQVQTKAAEIISKLGEVDYRHLVDTLGQTLDGVSALVNSPDLKAAIAKLDETVDHLNQAIAGVRNVTDGLGGQVGPIARSLRETAERAQETLNGLRLQVEPGSPLAYQLGRTLQDVGDAARAVRVLADELERNPSVVVRGKAAPEEHR